MQCEVHAFQAFIQTRYQLPWLSMRYWAIQCYFSKGFTYTESYFMLCAQKVSAYSNAMNTSGFCLTWHTDQLMNPFCLFLTVHFKVLVYNTDFNDQNHSCSGDVKMPILLFTYFVRSFHTTFFYSFLHNEVWPPFYHRN